MGIRFYCPNGHKLNVKEFQAGRRGICPFCGAKIDIPTQSTRRSSRHEQTRHTTAPAEGLTTAVAGTGESPRTAAPLEAGVVVGAPIGAAGPAAGAASYPAPSDPARGAAASAPSSPQAIGGFGPAGAATDPGAAPSAFGAPATGAVGGAAMGGYAGGYASAPMGLGGSAGASAGGVASGPAGYAVPGGASAPAASGAAGAAAVGGVSGDPLAEAGNVVWYVRPPSGGQYGPATPDIMRTWLQEGRIGPDSLVWREGWRDWQPASEVFPSLRPSGFGLFVAGGSTTAPSRGRGGSRSFSQALIITALVIAVLALLGVFVWVLLNEPGGSAVPAPTPGSPTTSGTPSGSAPGTPAAPGGGGAGGLAGLAHCSDEYSRRQGPWRHRLVRLAGGAEHALAVGSPWRRRRS